MNKLVKPIKRAKAKKRKYPTVKPAFLVFYEHDSDLLDKVYKHFLNHFPDRLRKTHFDNGSHEEMLLAENMDRFDHAYRRYLADHTETLRNFSKLVRNLIECELYHEGIILGMIDETEKAIMKCELYEIMPRHRKAKKKIIRLINIETW